MRSPGVGGQNMMPSSAWKLSPGAGSSTANCASARPAPSRPAIRTNAASRLCIRCVSAGRTAGFRRSLILRWMPPSRRLLRYLARYRRSFLFGFVCVVATTVLSLAAPWVLKYAIDDLYRAATAEKIRLYAGLLLALAAAGGFFRFLMRRVIIGASREVEYDLRNDFFAQLQRQPLVYFQQHRTGDLMSRATNDLSAVRMMIGPAVMYTTSTALTFAVAIVLMLSIAAWLTAVALVPLPFVS